MASAVNVRVGNELGAGNVTSAKRATLVSLTMHSESYFTLLVLYHISFYLMFMYFCDVAGMALVFASLIFAFRNYIGRIFTNEE